MTADPKAPGAAAVYLNVEQITNDPFHSMSSYARIKVLEEKGKELATVEVPYLYGKTQITDIQARTIHADGTVVPLVVKPEDLLIFKKATKDGDFQVNRKVFNLPSVEVGSILEYFYSVRYDDRHASFPTWDIQKPYFVHKAHYSFTPFKGFMRDSADATGRYLIDEHGRALNMLHWWTRLPQGVDLKRDGFGRFTLDITDVPPAPKEEWMPPIRSLLYRVLFYYKFASDNQNYWVDETKLWSKDVDQFAEPTKAIHQAVNGLIAPSDSELDKAKKLYKAVQALDNTDFSRKKSAPEMKQLKLREVKRAEDTWAEKSGSKRDMALLYLAMLRAAGLTAYDMRLVNREKGIFDVGYLNFGQLDDDVVILAIGGQEILLDPGEKMCPFQTLHWSHSAASGARQSPDAHYASTTPLQDYKSNGLLRIGDLTLDAQGAITGALRFVFSGQEALRWRQEALKSDSDELNKQFDRWLTKLVPDGVEAHIDHFLSIDDPEANLIAVVNLRGSLGTTTAKHLFLPAFLFESRGGHPFVDQEKRLEAVDMHFAGQDKEQITYHLPAGFSVESVPQDSKITWPEQAVLVSRSVSAAGQITIARTLVRAFTIARPEEYQDLRGFYQKVAAADQQQLVLTLPPAAKGN